MRRWLSPRSSMGAIPILCILPVSFATPAEDVGPAARWIPADAIVAIELSRPAALLDALLGQGVEDAVTSLPGYDKILAQPGMQQLCGFVHYMESQLGCDWRTGMRKLLGGGLTFAARPDGSTLLIVDAKDAVALGRLHEIVAGLAQSEAAKRGSSSPVLSRKHDGVTTWALAPEEAHAIVGTRLVLSNRAAAIDAALDLRSRPEAETLASNAGFRAALAACGEGSVARGFVNLAMLKQHPPFAQALAEGRNPLAALLFAGVVEALQASSWLGISLDIEGDKVSLRATTDSWGPESGPARFARPGDGAGALENLGVPRRIAALTLFRDLHGFYAAKDELFPERTSGLIFFENMMGIFFSGLDLTEEVFGEIQPEIRVVAAEQQYDPEVGTPATRLPGFAIVLRMKRPEQFGEVFEEAWQKALGLINFTRGQQALPGLIIDRRTLGDVSYTIAYFRPPKAGARENIDSRYNMRPALARVGEWLILSSTESLARDLIESVGKEGGSRPHAKIQSLLEVDGPQLLSILQANRENLVRQNMVEKGNTREKAESDIGVLLAALSFLERSSITLGGVERPQARWEIELRPAAKAVGARRAAPAKVAGSEGR